MKKFTSINHVRESLSVLGNEWISDDEIEDILTENHGGFDIQDQEGFAQYMEETEAACAS